jgi:hypothetical protein
MHRIDLMAFITLDNSSFGKVGKGFKVNIDGVGLDTSKNSGFTLGIDGVSFNSKQKGAKVFVDGISATHSKQSTWKAFRANVDGIGFSKVIQETIDDKFERALDAKLSQILNVPLGTYQPKTLLSSLKRVWRYVKGLVTSQPNIDDATSKLLTSHIQQTNLNNKNPFEYIYDKMSLDERQAIKNELMDFFSELSTNEKRAILGIYDKTLRIRLQVDNSSIDLNLTRRIAKTSDLMNGLDRFTKLYKDRMTNIASQFAKEFDQIHSSELDDDEKVTKKQRLINTFKDRMRGEIRKNTLGGYIFGAGGLQRLSGNTLQSMATTISEQFRYLDGFISDLYVTNNQGDEINPKIVINRTSDYSASAVGSFYTSMQGSAMDTYGASGYEARFLSAEHNNCPLCEEYASRGCQPVGSLPLPTQDSYCKQHCRCSYRTYASQELCEGSQEE